MALTTLKSLDAEIKQLEAQKKLVEKRDSEVPQAIAVLQKYSKVLTAAQRRQLAKLVGSAGDADAVAPVRAARPSKSSVKGRTLGKVAPKYRLPTGETWTGRGLTPKVFTAWAKSAEGKAWSAANVGEKYPAASSGKQQAKVGKAVVKKARKVGAKGKTASAPAKNGAKKIARNTVRKAKST
ncbi:histone-like nucleoid-structuring protein [Stenotrophomonas maltophilia]|uniref:Histone-like nucleoid-structuring protein n=1 Tax=Stenotrophomonas maltophilia TaxID=40324 RepID=A0A270MX85_STEMA|nr:H-NS family nucleoid-associated regulatory protein [Stenotrophomonas maltophilia]PAM64441.1 histone-like nucleoid-structuring protein [Stenotrophomonas maltophilia]PAM66645.1 histone-like nucleoid-structuring protein [Stenotrophomonas maltophilia]